MKRTGNTLLSALLAAILLSVPILPAVGAQANSEIDKSRAIVVKLAEGRDITSIAQAYNLKKIGEIRDKETSYLLLPAPASDLIKLMQDIRKRSGVVSVELNGEITSPLSALRQPVNFPGDGVTIAGTDAQLYRNQPLVAFLELSAMHPFSQGEGIKVAVIDTGADLYHPALAGRIAPGGYDFLDNDPLPYDEPGGPSYGHGTFIAALVLLLAPRAEILPLRVIAADGMGSSFDVAQAIHYAADQGARVINLSLGTGDRPEVVQEAIKYAIDRNCLIVAAMGNSNSDKSDIFPANESNVLGVASTDFNDLKSGFSNYGQAVALSAPGTDLVSAFPGGYYARWSGTSFAAPLVAAEGALVMAALPAYKRDESDVISVMVKPETVQELKSKQPQLDGKLGKGRIMPLKAVRFATTVN